MRRRFLFFAALLLFSFYACNNTETASAPPANVATDSSNFTQVQWMDTAINFGTVTKGEKVHITYKCKNVGSKPMFIYYVRPGCGCTVADYTKAAIPPGGTGEINAEYDSNHGMGQVNKSITVHTNTTNESPRLTFTGMVVAADSTKKSS
jgi:Protein of unknown function (DUF1573)